MAATPFFLYGWLVYQYELFWLKKKWEKTHVFGNSMINGSRLHEELRDSVLLGILDEVSFLLLFPCGWCKQSNGTMWLLHEEIWWLGASIYIYISYTVVVSIHDLQYYMVVNDQWWVHMSISIQTSLYTIMSIYISWNMKLTSHAWYLL